MSNTLPLAPGAQRDPSRASRPGVTSEQISRACFAHFVTRALPASSGDPEELATRLWPSDAMTRATLKAAQTVGASGDHGALIAVTVAEFLTSLPQSAAAGVMARCLALQLARNGSVVVPFDSDVDAVAPWVGEDEPIPVHSGIVGNLTLGPFRKLGVILTVSRNLARQPGAEGLFRHMLQSRAAGAFDAALFSSDAGDAVKVAGLLHGVTALPAGGAGNVTEALAALAGALAEAGGSGQVIVATDPATAATIQLRHPMLSWPVLASRKIPAGRIIALDPFGVVFGTGGDLDIENTAAALLHMSDEPAEIVASGGATADPVREIYQTDGIAMRALLDLAFAARPGAVQFIDGGVW